MLIGSFEIPVHLTKLSILPRILSTENLIMDHLNINSLRNKFKSLKLIISLIFDIF